MAAPIPRRPDRTGAAILFMVASTFLMAFQDAVVKLVSIDLPLWQLFVLRSAFVVPALIAVGWATGSIKPKAPGWSLARGMLLVAMYVAFYAALPVLDLSVVAAAYYTGPLLITLLSALFARDAIGLGRWIAVGIGFVGVLAIVRPGMAGFSPLTLIPILAALFYATAAIITRTKCAEESVISLSLALNVSFIGVGAIATGGLATIGSNAGTAYPFLLGGWVAVDGGVWGAIGLLAAVNLAIHLGLAKAYQNAPAPTVATFDYSYLVFAAFWGFALFREVPEPATVAGMILIAGAGLLSLRMR